MKLENGKEESSSVEEVKERLIKTLKKEVKQLMEESVAKKTVHEESSNVSALCSSVDTCLQTGLRRRSLGLFKTSSSSSALLTKISKDCPEAKDVIKKIQELEKKASEAESPNRSIHSIHKVDSSSNLLSSSSNRFYWIRISLFEKKLHKIVAYLVSHSDRFYEPNRSVVGDPDLGQILASLIVGPCALEFSRFRQTDHFWTDPPADELVQRHRISSTKLVTQPSVHKSSLKKTLSIQVCEATETRRNSIPVKAREYVESLHQNRTSALLYGKNNVQVVQPDWPEPLPGYLSLHQVCQRITLKWTPNSLMDGRQGEEEVGPREGCPTWQQAVIVSFSTILYLHCHQDQDKKGRLVMVGIDGIQYPPLSFPPGDSLPTFLGCLETALLPQGIITPPVSGILENEERPPRRSSISLRRKTSNEDKEEAGNSSEKVARGKDTVFKITYLDQEKTVSGHDLLQKTRSVDWFANIFHMNKKSSSLSFASPSDGLVSPQTLGLPPNYATQISYDGRNGPLRSPSTPLKGLCNTMRKQLISRAFYGWRAHCRHSRTIKDHLHDLVLVGPEYEEDIPCLEEGLTEGVWQRLRAAGLEDESSQKELYQRVYRGGVEDSLRREVWQYLLGHLDWADSVEEIQCKESRLQSEYEAKISEWGALEAIVMQQDREITAANVARLSISKSTESLTSIGLACEVFSSIEEPCPPSPERPSTILELTEHSSTSTENLLSRGKKTSASSEASSSALPGHPNSLLDPPQKRKVWALVSASDEGIEDINEEETESLSSHPGGLKLAAMYKVTTPSIDSGNPDCSPPDRLFLEDRIIERRHSQPSPGPDMGLLAQPRTQGSLSVGGTEGEDGPAELLMVPLDRLSACPSPASSEGGTYSTELLETFGLNLHRIDKDVARCDRNLPYFQQQQNLEKLRNVVTTYVWQNLEVGYMQGMCDLVAPLLVVLEDEVVVFSCFQQLMTRMIENFPTGSQMDDNFGNMRALMQVLDGTLYDKIQQNGDFSHFYFCYRWFLLDFKREFCYEDVYRVWETIWAAQMVASPQFFLFIALGLVESYRDIILDRNMDFTDIIKFFNEMAERHGAEGVLAISRDLVDQLRDLIEDS